MVPGVRLVLLGKQGAGKGTQCVRLSRHYVVPHISTGDMLRAAAKSGTTLGAEVAGYMRIGELVPDDVIIKTVEHRLDQHDTKERGFILDGFPRTVPQAEALESLLAPRGLDLVLDLEVPTEVVLDRLASRRVCNVCGQIFGMDNPARRGNICDNCGGDLIQRDDDTEDSIRRRLELYAMSTEPLITWYLERHKLAAVDGLGSSERVTGRLVRAIDNRRHYPPDSGAVGGAGMVGDGAGFDDDDPPGGGIADDMARGMSGGMPEGIAGGRADGMAGGRGNGMADARADGMAGGRGNGMADARPDGVSEHVEAPARPLPPSV